MQVSVAQGHIGHIKNQGYLKLKSNIACNNTAGDNLSLRICANLAFQKSDSLLCIVYDSLIAVTAYSDINSAKLKITGMQDLWRAFRDLHCGLIYDSYNGSASGHVQAIEYLNCLKELTDCRTKELQKLLDQLKSN